MEQPATRTPPINLRAALTELYAHVSATRRRQLALLLALMFVGALLEVATIGSVIPFLTLLAQPHSDGPLPGALHLFTSIVPGLADRGLLAAASAFAGFAILAALVRLQLSWVTQNFAYRLGHEPALETQARILAQPYVFHLERHSSALISATDKVEILIFDMILPLMQSVIAAFIAAFLIAGLLYIDVLATALAAAAFTAIYVVVSLLTRRHLAENSSVVGRAYHKRLQIEQESLGGIRDVILDDAQAAHLNLFERVNDQLARARATTKFISHAPRFIVEGAGMVVLTVIAVMISRGSDGIALALPFLGALALGSQRLLPLLQTVYSGWSMLAAHRSIIGQIVELLRMPLLNRQVDADERKLRLRRKISFDDVSFVYKGRADRPTINSVTLDIPAGATVALIGKTGSGKSTFADLLMGLLEPSSGTITIDDVPLTSTTAHWWRQNIAHVSQSIFLADTTVAQNIAMSLPNQPPHRDLILAAAKQAQLHEFILSLPDGYETFVGERGVRLSGGQRQRLGIARAIYKQTGVLVFDEATSALDDATERNVMETLKLLRQEGRTIVIIAHRISTLRYCDFIIRFERGRIVSTGSFDAEFREHPLDLSST